MSRFDEDLVFADPNKPPASAGSLLSHLGVFGEPRDVQRAAVAAWLAEHPMPSDFVRRGLVRMGALDGEHRAA